MDIDATLPVAHAASLEATQDVPWLIESLWGQQAVGIIGGCPKVGKSWLGLDIAVSVASRTPCLGRYEVHTPGRALVYLAEDTLPQVRGRIASLCRSRAVDINTVDVQVITAPTLRLDVEHEQKQLIATVARYEPVLLLLDPLVRLHCLDENSSADVASLLGFLRHIQRTYGTAIAVVHHMSKKRKAALGQALRGSSDIHAWADSSAYLVRGRDALTLSVEHRAAPAPRPIALQLAVGDTPHLHVVDVVETTAKQMPLAEAIRRVIVAADAPLTRAALRAQLRVNNARLGDALLRLQKDNHIDRVKDGWIAKTTVQQPSPQ